MSFALLFPIPGTYDDGFSVVVLSLAVWLYANTTTSTIIITIVVSYNVMVIEWALFPRT